MTASPNPVSIMCFHNELRPGYNALMTKEQ